MKYLDPNNIYVGGTCISKWNETVIVLDEYSVLEGTHNATFRQLYNLTDVGFFDLNLSTVDTILNGFGLIPPEVTIKAPVNETLVTTIENKYFYVGFTHLMFSGLARIEHDKIAQDWSVKKLPDHRTLVNPSFVSPRNLVATNDGLTSLLDPSLNGILSLFMGKMRHLTRWHTKKELGQIVEKQVYNIFT